MNYPEKYINLASFEAYLFQKQKNSIEFFGIQYFYCEPYYNSL